MRYPPEHKAAARSRLLEAGGALVKKSGFAGTGMDALAAAAGVTSGALYSQFRSKTELLHAIVDHELMRTVNAFMGADAEEMKRILAWYTSANHVNHPEYGCAIPSLGPEIARADASTREHFETLLRQIVNLVEPSIKTPEQTWALLAQIVGGVMLARAVLNESTQHEILASVQNAATGMLTSSD